MWWEGVSSCSSWGLFSVIQKHWWQGRNMWAGNKMGAVVPVVSGVITPISRGITKIITGTAPSWMRWDLVCRVSGVQIVEHQVVRILAWVPFSQPNHQTIFLNQKILQRWWPKHRISWWSLQYQLVITTWFLCISTVFFHPLQLDSFVPHSFVLPPSNRFFRPPAGRRTYSILELRSPWGRHRRWLDRHGHWWGELGIYGEDAWCMHGPM